MRAPSHATVVAYAALLVALSGSAYAAAKITSADIKDNTITSADVRNKALGLSDLSPTAKKKLKGPLELPPLSTVVSSKGSPAKNGARLVAALASLPTATDARPRTLVLGPGHYALTTSNGVFEVPAYVTLVGQGPRTVLENTATGSFLPVVRLKDYAVLRGVAIKNAGATGGAGVDAAAAVGTVVDDVAVEARVGVTVRAATVRDVTIRAVSDGLRVQPPGGADVATQVDNVTIALAGGSAATGLTLAGPALVDGVDADVRGNGNVAGVLMTAVAGAVEVRDSSFRANLGSSSIGVWVDPPGASSALLLLDHVRAIGGLAVGNSWGLRTSGEGTTVRVGSSVVDGDDDEVSEVQAADARCIDTHDAGYAIDVVC